MEPIPLDEKITFHKEHFVPNILYASPGIKMPLICMEPGQEIPPHAGHAVGIFYVKEGKGIFTLDNQRIDMEKGSVIIAPEGATRGMRCVERMVVLAISAG
ncbi:MAG: cupin domain-containing protein [Candidatus Loosdrechtia sp.]|uniref:cupin domain-containing protein n=1 Tax=Candidatus Loosdrechtia sp. TaxID=3101272 RepID=UPI003A66DAA2|nr:MAG: cupin domain-containing protein [Candidatus Jettenia sp. AMX2]